MITNRDRCWISHKRRESWRNCPLCGAPIAWVKINNAKNGEWTPCDDEPVMIATGTGAKGQAVFRHELWTGCRPYAPGRDRKRPMLGRFPHYYTCPVLLEDRRNWARAHGKYATEQ